MNSALLPFLTIVAIAGAALAERLADRPRLQPARVEGRRTSRSR
jgi:hypothetical protein